MATKFYSLSGIAQWPKVFEGMKDVDYDHYGLDIALDEPSIQTYKESGLQLVLKTSGELNTKGKEIKWFTEEKGVKFLSLRRKDSQLIKGKTIHFGPPQVVDANGDTFGGPIGNGSRVTARVAVYDSAKGKGHRLEAIRVDELVKYERPDDVVEGVIPKLKF